MSAKLKIYYTLVYFGATSVAATSDNYNVHLLKYTCKANKLQLRQQAEKKTVDRSYVKSVNTKVASKDSIDCVGNYQEEAEALILDPYGSTAKKINSISEERWVAKTNKNNKKGVGFCGSKPVMCRKRELTHVGVPYKDTAQYPSDKTNAMQKGMSAVILKHYQSIGWYFELFNIQGFRSIDLEIRIKYYGMRILLLIYEKYVRIMNGVNNGNWIKGWGGVKENNRLRQIQSDTNRDTSGNERHYGDTKSNKINRNNNNNNNATNKQLDEEAEDESFAALLADSLDLQHLYTQIAQTQILPKITALLMIFMSTAVLCCFF